MDYLANSIRLESELMRKAYHAGAPYRPYTYYPYQHDMNLDDESTVYSRDDYFSSEYKAHMSTAPTVLQFVKHRVRDMKKQHVGTSDRVLRPRPSSGRR